jgi:hypothetical protein
MRAQDNTEGVARPIVVRLFLWLARTFRWKYEVNVSHADLGGSPQRHNHSRPSCNQDDAGLDRNPIWSPEDKRIAALMPSTHSGSSGVPSEVHRDKCFT